MHYFDKDENVWKRLREDPAYEKCVRFIKSTYEKVNLLPLAPLLRSDRLLFEQTGSRKEFEEAYFRRRRFLTTAALLALIYPEEERYLKETELLLEETAKEFAWALPAHTAGLGEKETEEFVDLFSAETGFAVSEICSLLQDRLNPNVRALAEREVRRRVLVPFLHNTFWWEQSQSNWAAVCAGGVGGAFLYLAPELYPTVAPRIKSAINSFLSSFPEDGTCLEGFSYWHYGFGEFIWFADLVNYYSGGKENYFAEEKIERIAGYAQRSFLKGNTSVSFSDSARECKADRALISYLSSRYPQNVHPLPEARTEFSLGNGGWLQLSRLCLFYRPSENGSLPQKDYFLPDAGQAILNRAHYSLAVKAGHNAEPHNHNDVGSFILATERGQVLCDLGSGLYTRQYFSENERYNILCNGSRGHSVPIVNGSYERAGREFCGSILYRDDTVEVEFAGAYGQEGFTTLRRTFFCKEKEICLTDTFSSDYKSLTERFVLLAEPRIERDCVLIENVKIHFDAEECTPVCSVEKHALHEKAGEKTEENVYLLDFPLKEGLTRVRFLFEIL